MDIDSWLREIGLSQYAEIFRANDIDGEVLSRLTNGDLKDIGVASLGHRKKLLDAIAALAATPDAAPPAPVAAAQPKTADASAERRHLTVMFCDLVGSTSLAASLDAEDWRNLVGAYLDAASAAVTQMGGHVAKKLGDGVMALFGFPVAQENDCERAVRAALAIQRALADLNARNAKTGAPELQARIGLDAGPVVVEALGEVFGDAPNVAARVQAAAEPGAVIVTAAVQRQTAGLFVAEDRGEHQLRGVPAPVTLYRIVRASGGGRRGGARSRTALVGREDELALIMRRWSRTLQGEGQFVQIVGEPGIGKSRLIEEFRARLGETPHTWVEWASSQLLQNTPLHPVAEWGRQRFGGAEIAAERRLADLENTLGLIGLDAAEYAPLLAPLVDIPLEEGRAAKFSPEELRRRQLAALTAWLLAGARSQAVALAFEDLHWADPTSLDLLARLAERGQQAPLFIIATTRPEFRPPWSLRSHHGVVSLAPLSRGEVKRMVGELASRHALSSEVVEGLSERTGGVPLFVEEVTRLLLERGGEGGAQAIPPTLQQSLAARLDRLGPAREIAQIGAVLGREFSYALLASVAAVADRGPAVAAVASPSKDGRPSGRSMDRGLGGLSEAALQSALERLAEADLLIVEDAGPQANYRFKHALIQDAAYESLLKSRRQALHRRAAEVLRDAEAEPEAIAHHFTEAALDDLAIEWWGRAGDQALRRSAFQEAIAHLGKAIAMADKGGAALTPRVTAGVGSAVERLKLQTAYGRAMVWSKGFSSDEAEAAFTRARELAVGAEHVDERFVAYYGSWITSFGRGEWVSAREFAETFLSEAENLGRLTEVAVAHRLLGFTSYGQGEFTKARAHCEDALRIYDPERDRETRFRYGIDTGFGASVYLACAMLMLGDIDEARKLIEESVARAVESDHVPELMNAYLFKARIEQNLGHAEVTLRDAEMLALIHRNHQTENWGTMYAAWARARIGDRETGIADLRRAVAASLEENKKANIPHFQGWLAELEAEGGDLEGALARIDEGLTLARQTGGRSSDAFLHLLRGEILLRRDPEHPTLAEEAFLTAVAIAKRQSARFYGLHAALKLAKLYRSTGRPVEAHDVLASALEGFTPTPEMPEIAEAQALLAALAETNEVKAEAARRQRQAQLHVAYGNALIAARGPGAPETTEAFASARERAHGDKDAPERLAADYGLYVGSLIRGELPSMRAHAAAFLADVEARPDSGEAGVAHRAQGITNWFAGEYREAHPHLERALALFQPGRDDDLSFWFGHDAGAAAMAYLALAAWPLGEMGGAISLVERMRERTAVLTHSNTLAFAATHAAFLALMSHDGPRAQTNMLELTRIVRDHDLPVFRAFGAFFEGCVAADAATLTEGLERLRRGVELLRERNVLLFDGLVKIALAEAEARAGDVERALAILDEALATCERTGHRTFEAELHRVRAETLFRRDPSNPAPAEEAFQTAIAVAREQGTRSFELRASLALAKVCQSTGRPVEAHGVLAPALEGFSRTPEMPEIGEAQALLAALEKADEMKSAAASRRLRLKLQTSYGLALSLSRGSAAEEIQATAARAKQLAGEVNDPAAGLAAYRTRFIAEMADGRTGSARTTAEAYLRDAKNAGAQDVVLANFLLGYALTVQGAFSDARAHLQEGLEICGPVRDSEVASGRSLDWPTEGISFLALVCWCVGEVERARELIEAAKARADELQHGLTSAVAYFIAPWLESFRGDAQATLRDAEALAEITARTGIRFISGRAKIYRGWARARLGDHEAGFAECRQGVAEYAEHSRSSAQTNLGLLAELEAVSEGPAAALARIDEALALAARTGQVFTDAHLHCIRGDILLKADPRHPARAEEAYLAAIAIAREQGARSFGLQAALKIAKVYQSTGRPVEEHDVLAPALEGFAPTPEMPEIAEAEALLAALAETDEVKAAEAQRQRRTQLHVAYGNALIAARGYGASETSEAFARARELAVGGKDAPERLAADYGLWVGNYVRGELSAMRAHAETFLGDVEARPHSPEAGVAHRAAGITHWFAGEYLEAREHLEKALALFQPGRDDDLAFRFGQDAGVTAMQYLAIALWALGHVDRAVSLAAAAGARIAGLAHIATRVNGAMHKAIFEMMRGDLSASALNSAELSRLTREHDLPHWRAFGIFLQGLATAESGAPGGGLDEMRRGAGLLRDRNVLVVDGLIKIALADAEARAGDADRALTILDDALATCERTGHRSFEAELHRVRGEMLVRRNPANPTLAEEALQTAIAVSKRQATRSFELRASLALTKLYQSTGRPADAHDVLTPALEGFSSTPEMPEIAEAEALLAALAETDEWKAAATSRERRLKLQTSYGQAMIWSKGFAAEETKAVLAQTERLAALSDNVAERMKARSAQWVALHVGGELEAAHEAAESFLREAKSANDAPAAASAARALGLTCLFRGQFAEARKHLDEALHLYRPSWEASARRLYGTDPGISAKAYLAMVAWQIGDAAGAAALFEEASTEAVAFEHAPTTANTFWHRVIQDMVRGDAAATQRTANLVLDVSEKNAMRFYGAGARMCLSWAEARLGDSEGLARFRSHGQTHIGQGSQIQAPLFHGRLAELEAEQMFADEALTSIDRGIESAREGDIRWTDALLHRIRGDILLRRDPANVAPAEDAYLTAIAIAHEQGTRSFSLRAALALAKLYQSTARPAEAHAVLAPALEGFAPTPEMPEIAEAQALLAALAESDEVMAAIGQRRRRLDLQTSYGQALQLGKGFAAEETRAAFARVREFVRPNEDPAAQFAADYAQCLGSFFRGEFTAAQEIAETFLRDAEADGRATEAGAARRLLALVLFFQGDLKAARSFYERALADFVLERDGDARRIDGQAGGTAILASVVWHFGEVERARLLIEQAMRRARELGHPATIAHVLNWSAYLEIRRDDVAAARLAADASTKLAEEHGIDLYAIEGRLCAYWAGGRLVDPEVGASGLRQALQACMAKGNRNDAPFFHGMLAELEAATRGPDSALTLIDQGLTIAEETGGRLMEPYLHRLRGDILLKRDPADPAPAEDAYRTAIAIAKQQGARAYELLGSLSLAKLRQSTGRPVDAHAVLAPALEGFSPTPEMPEIAEAQALLAGLAETDEVKAAAAQRGPANFS